MIDVEGGGAQPSASVSRVSGGAAVRLGGSDVLATPPSTTNVEGSVADNGLLPDGCRDGGESGAGAISPTPSTSRKEQWVMDEPTGVYKQTEDESYIAPVEVQPPVHDVVARLDKQLSKLFSMIDDLSEQLASVRNPAPTTEASKTLRDVGGVSPLAMTLGNMVERVRDEQERLTVLMSELEI